MYNHKTKKDMKNRKSKSNNKINMKTKSIAIIFLFVMSIFFSCKKEEKKNILQIETSIDNSNSFKNDVVEFKFEFPDTVYVNETNEGKIKYKGILDTIATEFDFKNEKKSRYIIYSYTKAKSINYTDKALSQMTLDTIGAVDSNTILLSGIKFNQLGTYYIDGIINDSAYLSANEKDKDGEDLMRVITNEVRATHKVVVIEKQ